ncbi:unnamed protein product [Diamesa hyperborea]
MAQNKLRNTFEDDYDHSSDDLEYILENILQENDGSEEFKELKEQYNSKIINKCICDASDCNTNCIHGGNYKVIDNELVLNEDRVCKDLIYECHDDCLCDIDNCFNRLAAFGPRDGLKIVQFSGKGDGLITTEFINKGAFICEYAGEILTKNEAIRRDDLNVKSKRMNYIFCLNEICLMNDEANKQPVKTFIDPTYKGNIGRYLNHSCFANCDIISVRVDSIIPKFGIFANRHISPMEELTFSYGTVDVNQEPGNLKLCHCQSLNCMKYLPNLSFI